MLQLYIKKNQILNLILFVAVITIVSYGVTYNTPVLKGLNVEIVNYFYEVLVNISIGYVVSLIFYVLVVCPSQAKL